MSRVTVDSETGYASWWCPLCGGSSHPATGCVYSPTFVVCRRCTLEACAWIQAWTRNKGRRRGPSFYESI